MSFSSDITMLQAYAKVDWNSNYPSPDGTIQRQSVFARIVYEATCGSTYKIYQPTDEELGKTIESLKVCMGRVMRDTAVNIDQRKALIQEAARSLDGYLFHLTPPRASVGGFRDAISQAAKNVISSSSECSVTLPGYNLRSRKAVV